MQYYGIVDSAGNEVVKYIYDPWGKILSTSGSLASTLATIQPFRYRGYVYDEETDLYYLRSRYYRPNQGKFINADVCLGKVSQLGSHNTFLYCKNKPILLIDPTGLTSIYAHVTKQYTFYNVEGGIGGAIFSVGVAEFISNAIDKISSLFDSSSNENEKSVAIDATKTPKKSQAVYVGARILNGQFVTLTNDMEMDEAVTWAYTIAIATSHPANIGKNTSWGIYTPRQSDAYAIYPYLLPVVDQIGSINTGNVTSILSAPILETNKPGEYPHLHLPSRLFNNRYRHFHIWYGSIGGQ